MVQNNQEFVADDRVVVNLDRAESAIVVALDEQAVRVTNDVNREFTLAVLLPLELTGWHSSASLAFRLE